jgi:DNA-binding NarL/FixJ family response regulator
MFCSQTISVYILMQQRISALGLQSVLAREKDMEVLVLKPDSGNHMQAIRNFCPDILITDAPTFCLQSNSALTKIIKSGTTKILFLCSASGDEAAEILALGADGLIARSARAELLAVAVRALARGRGWIDETIWRENLQNGTSDITLESVMSRLSSREKLVLRLAAEGFDNREIARALNLSYELIKCSMWLIIRKLRARGRVHAVSVARKCGMFS